MLSFMATTAAALTPSPTLRAPLVRHSRAQPVVAQYDVHHELPVGWTVSFDQGTPFFCFDQSGECQWDPPQAPTPQQDYMQQDYMQRDCTQQEFPQQEYQQDYAPQGYADLPAAARYDMNDLPAGWATGFDQATGTTYYYCEQTGQCQAEPPHASAASQQQGGYPLQGQVPQAQLTWHVTSATGWTPRFGGKYKLKVGEEEILGRYDMGEFKPTRPWVSREQCVVHVKDDGGAILVSRGKPPTGWRAHHGAQWQWLTKHETHALADGEQVSLDYQDPEGTVFTCQLEG